MNSSEGGEQSQISATEAFHNFKIKQYTTDKLIDQFSFMLIRPPRFLYNPRMLCLNDKKLKNKYTMQVVQIPFELTLYTVQNMEYIVLYLHGNSSSRIEGKMHVSNLPEGVGLACFDFDGCGLRSQSFITLGKKQSAEVDTAAKYLKNRGYKVVGWGRSMGAVSLLISQQCDIMVADSPFDSLGDLCKQASSKFLPSYCCCIFNCLYPCFFSCIRKDVQSKSGLDINELQIGKLLKLNLRNNQRFLIVLAGTKDNMIPCKHGMNIYENFPGKKQKIIFDGSHNSQRPSVVLKSVFELIHQYLGIKNKVGSKYHYQIVKKIDSQEYFQTNGTKSFQVVEMENINKQQSMGELFQKSSGMRFPNSMISDGIAYEHCNERQDDNNKESIEQSEEPIKKKGECILSQNNMQLKLIQDENMEKQTKEKQSKTSIKIYPPILQIQTNTSQDQ